MNRIVCLSCTSVDVDKASFLGLAEACYRFTPKVAIRKNEAIFLDFHGFETIPSTLSLRLQTLSQRFKLPIHITAADHPRLAFALARFPQYTPSTLPMQALADYLSPFFEDPELSKKVQKFSELLGALGLHRLQDFKKLPPQALASRFGKELSELGRLPLVWPRFHPQEKILERTSIPFCSEWEGLQFVLKGLLDRVIARLRARQLRVAALRVLFVLENRRTREWTVRLPIPQSSSIGLLSILRDRFLPSLDREPLSAPAIGISLEVLETAPGRKSQKNFFEKLEEDAESWEALMGRLSIKLGKNRAFVAAPVDRYLPEKSWRAESSTQLPIPFSDEALPVPRPTVLLKKPETLRKKGDLLIHLATKNTWRVLQWQGPERLSGEWWMDPKNKGFSRDYYRVFLENGSRLWIFNNHESSSYSSSDIFYLHGYFD